MDAYLAVVSKRERRDYDGRGIPDEVVRRILEAGRMTGSSQNAQRWRFVAVESRDLLDRIAETVYAPANVKAAPLAVAIVMQEKGPAGFDAGRAAQNMMIAAANEGVGSCPNGMPDPGHTGELLAVSVGERPQIVLTFGYPPRPRDPESRPSEEWIERADRKPFEQVVERR